MSDTHLVGFSIRAQIGRALASCIDAWNEVRPPKDDYERWLCRFDIPKERPKDTIELQDQ